MFYSFRQYPLLKGLLLATIYLPSQVIKSHEAVQSVTLCFTNSFIVTKSKKVLKTLWRNHTSELVWPSGKAIGW